MKRGRPINQKKTASVIASILIDDRDRHLLEGRGWHLQRGYAYTHPRGEEPSYLHGLIMRPPPGFFVDHINGNRADNRRENLRIVTKSQNQMNAKKTTRPKTSQFKGVHWGSQHKMWHAKIKKNQKNIFLGLFKVELSAALAYDKAARNLFGDFAKPNFPAGGAE